MHTPTPDHYNVLGVQRCANKDEIRNAYKNKALQLHPDKNPNGEALFKLVVNAYQTLISPSKKCVYDRELDLKECRRGAYGAPPGSGVPSGRRYQGAPAAAAGAPPPPPPPGGAAPTGTTPRGGNAENIFRDAYTHYKAGTNAGYTYKPTEQKERERRERATAAGPGAGAAPFGGGKPAPGFYEECNGNFSEWFKKKQDEFRVQEEASRQKAEQSKRMEDDERDRAEAWRRQQREREKERESDLEREKEKRRREHEVQRKETEERIRNERAQALFNKAKEFQEQQMKQQESLEKHLSDLQREKEVLRVEKERIAREKAEVEREAVHCDVGRRERQRQREAEIAEEQVAAEEKLRLVREQQEMMERDRQRLQREREADERREALASAEREEVARQEAERLEEERRAKSEERKTETARLNTQRRRMMDDVVSDRKRHEAEVAAMREESDRIEAEMRAKLEALRQAKREGRPINLEDFKL